MVLRPAAAARSARARGENAFDTRLRGLLVRADRVERNRLAERLLPASFSDPSAPEESPEARLGFYWLRVAEWLADGFDLRSSARGRELFDDLCWIQYCVYGVFRVQDDLVDGESGEALLAVEANQLWAEATRCSARWFDGGSLFWEVFGQTIDQTSRAIVALHDLQRRVDREPHAELALYVDLAAALKIGAAGVAIAAGRERDWVERISPALDQLAVAGQILDDLEDVDDDLADGRVNYAAWWLSRPVVGETPEAMRGIVAFNLTTGDRLAGLIDVARRHVARAAEVLGTSVCPPVHRFLGIYGRRVDRIETAITLGRERLFAPRQTASAA